MKASQWYFYRVEDCEGRGPYCGKNCDAWMNGNHGVLGDKIHPDPERDDHFSVRRDCIFGFQTLTQLQRWFDSEELRKLNRLGYRIVRVLGVEVVSTSTQSMFVKV